MRDAVLGSACALAMLAAVTVAGQPAVANWPQFRGTNASGVASGAGAPPTTWTLTPTLNVAWTRPVAGLGHSSPIVWGDTIYLTTAVGADGKRDITLGDVDKSGVASANDTGRHAWHLIALDRTSGSVRWDRVVHEGVPRMKRHVKASHASATPATDGRHIVALMGSEGLFGFDMQGRQLWRVDLGVLDVGLVGDPTLQWGPASSPVIFGDMVLVQNDRHRDSFLAAFDVRTGKELWRAPHDEFPSWATPAVVPTKNGAEIVTNAGKFIRGFDAKTGKELWRLSDNQTQVKVPTPVVAGDLVIVTGGYPPGGRPIYALRPGGTGELAGDALAWKVDRGAPYTATPIVYQGVLYALTDNGILSAYDPQTGQRIYQQRVAGGSGFSASPVAAGGRLYLSSEDGDVYVVKAGRTYELLATNRLAEPVMATPAIVGDTLYIRTLSFLLAIRSRS